MLPQEPAPGIALASISASSASSIWLLALAPTASKTATSSFCLYDSLTYFYRSRRLQQYRQSPGSRFRFQWSRQSLPMPLILIDWSPLTEISISNSYERLCLLYSWLSVRFISRLARMINSV